MARKNAIYALTIFLLLSFLFSGCGTAGVIDSKVKNAVSDTSRSDEAVQWLIANEDIIIPELVNRMSYASAKKAEQAAQALMLMGEVGRSGVISLFDTMSETGKSMWCTVLAEENTKQAVIELLIISSHDEAFEMAVSAMLSMGDVSLNYLSGQLHNQYYQEAVDTVLANFGDEAVDLIIPAVHSDIAEKANRALVILATVGESAAEKLALDALNNSSGVDDAITIANTMLKNYPEVSIASIMGGIDESTDVEIAAELLFEISGTEYIEDVLCGSDLGDEDKTSEILKYYVELCGVEPVIDIALGGDADALSGAVKALGGGDYDDEVAIAILSGITADDADGSDADAIAETLIDDETLYTLVHSVITQDTTAFLSLIDSGMTQGGIGSILSGAADNENIYERMVSMAADLESDSKLIMYTILASCSDGLLPTIVLDVYAGEDTDDLAAQALSAASVANGKFLFSEVDMLPYADKIIEGLESSNETKNNYAQIILSRTSEAKSTNAFYIKIFEQYKDSSIFAILAGHYGGTGSLSLGLYLDVDGTQVVPETISIEFSGDVSSVSEDDEPDYTTLITGFAPYLSWSEVDEESDVELVFECDITPKSKTYSGLLSGSYLGAVAEGTLTAYVDGEKVASASGYAYVAPPDEYPGPEGDYIYMSDPEDAPAGEAYIICFINAMYNMWGEKALYGFYNYDAASTLEAAEDLLDN